ncbi:MAG: hypothetical protein KBF25_03050 [Chitinophagaceae bacterium]|jgi:hypothetical protein|nr:hypothetical protein [Chitinophagaceae bacterium]
MPHRATLALDSLPLKELIHCELRFHVPMNAHNRPIGRPRPDLIDIVVSSDSDADFARALYFWCELRQQKSGEITFYRQDNAAALKTLSFVGAYCVKYHEVFDAIGTETMKIHISISAASTYMYDGDGFSSEWAGTAASESGGSGSSSSSSSSSSGSGEVSSFNAS